MVPGGPTALARHSNNINNPLKSETAIALLSTAENKQQRKIEIPIRQLADEIIFPQLSSLPRL
jgi:hypothetical protein